MGPLYNIFSLVSVLFSNPNSQLSVADVTKESKKVFTALNEPNSFQYSASPTIKFSFVPSPLAFQVRTESNDKKINDDTSGNNEKIFERVRESLTSSDDEKPLVLLLPGLDGVGISITSQLDDLSSNFEVWQLGIDPKSDRTSFHELVTLIVEFLDEATEKCNEREVILVGESFGGLLAPNVALRIQNRSNRLKRNMVYNESFHLKGLVMVNPGTSYDETQWSTLGPLLFSLRHLENQSSKDEDKSTVLPTPYSVLGGLALALTIPDSTQFNQITDIILSDYGSRQPGLGTLQEAFESMREGFQLLEQNLPADTLEHRLTRWFPVGLSTINSQLSNLNVSSLVIAGDEDKMLPSKKEAVRLSKEMPNCERVEIKGSGHFILDDRVNLTDIILNSNIFPQEERIIDPIVDWRPPNEQEFNDALENNVVPLRRLTSPIFFSTDDLGQRTRGLSRIPVTDEGPLLFVANHQLFGLDLGLIISQLIEERGIYARGLAHPIIFNGAGQLEGSNRDDMDKNNDNENSQNSLFQKFGAVKVTPRNFYRLMDTKQNALLFPGGVREVFHGKDEEYKLFWPEKVDFVRIAAKFNATIVPLSSLGAAESANILVDAPDMVKLPFGIGERISNSSANTVAGRFDTDASNELFTPPFAVPKPLPARHYFMFGRPMSTKHIDHRNREDCEKLYHEIKDEMQRGFDDVLKAREKDPFKDTVRRIALEQITGKPAPTFGLDEFH